MNTNNKQYKATAVIGFCLVLTATCLTAQDIGYYKLITTPYDTCVAWNNDIVEVNNQYYILSVGYYVSAPNANTVTVFDKNLNQVQQFLLDGGGINFETMGEGLRVFYKNNHFYILGKAEHIEEGKSTFYFAKYNENFELVQPVSSYDMTNIIYEEDTLNVARGFWVSDILLTRNNEFIVFLYEPTCRLLRLNAQGELLEEVLLHFATTWGNLVETDSHYILSMSLYWNFIILFNKDSLSDYKDIRVIPKGSDMSAEGSAVVVDNRLIRAYEVSPDREECPDPIREWETDRRIIFYNEDLSEKKRIELGLPCINEFGAAKNYNTMHYRHPDSIYYAYCSSEGNGTSTIAIACFSSEGELHFNHTFSDITDSVVYHIYMCKAVSDGGMLITGVANDPYNEPYPHGVKGFLLYYHPPAGTGIVEAASLPSIQIYPNPTTNQLRITNYELRHGAAEYSIYSVAGQKVMHGTLQDETSVINLAPLAKGMYFLRVGEKTVKVVRE